MKLVATLTLVLALAPSAAFAGEMELRDKWSRSISAAQKGECKKESKIVHENLDLAAALIFHGEYEDAREALSKAGANAKSRLCREAVKIR